MKYVFRNFFSVDIRKYFNDSGICLLAKQFLQVVREIRFRVEQAVGLTCSAGTVSGYNVLSLSSSVCSEKVNTKRAGEVCFKSKIHDTKTECRLNELMWKELLAANLVEVLRIHFGMYCY